MVCNVNSVKLISYVGIALVVLIIARGLFKVRESYTNSANEVTSSADLKSKCPEDGVALVKFYTDWCGYCKRLAPTWDKLAGEYDNTELNGKKIRILSVDCEKYKSIGKEFGVEGFPTIKVISPEGVSDYAGGRTYEAFEKFLKSL
jgi:protein disulfide-isomerase-like protein